MIGSVIDSTITGGHLGSRLLPEQRSNADDLQDYYRQFFDEAPDLFASVDPKTATIKNCNETLCQRLGYSKEEIIGMPLRQVYHPDSHSDMELLFQSFVDHGHAEADHLKLIAANGESIHVSLRVSSHRNDNGDIVESRSIWRDITSDIEVQRLELELRVQEAQKMEGLALLAGGIAHDFNNMLVAMLGNASLCLNELPAESVVRSKIESIETAAQRAADLTRQLLAYSGSMNHEQSNFDLSKVVEEMGHLLSVAISHKVVLNYDLAQDPVSVLGDITQIRQVIMNLLTNASDAVGDRSGLVTIRTGLQHVDAKYLRNTTLGAELEPGYFGFLEISDTGRGIDGDDQKRIFDPFYTTKAKGHGLGLAAVLGIVRSHNGALRVYSEPGNGTTIRVLFPAREYAPNQDARGLTDLPTPANQRILIVDDEEHVRAVAQQMLEYLGFQVTVANDGREALQVYSADPGHYDLVLMDISMPHMDGVAAYKALHEVNPDCRVVLMSGYSEQQATNSLIGRSFKSFVQKPFSQDVLLRTVMECLGDEHNPET